MDWKTCVNSRLAKNAKIDENLIKSLLEISDDKLNTSNLININKKTYSSIITLLYDSLREILEAYALKKGFKIYNHECYTSFIKEILNDQKLSERFDRIRLIRNSINYYGRGLTDTEFKDTRNEIIALIKILRYNFLK